MHAELLRIEQHVVEGGLRLEGLELAEQIVGGGFRAVRLLHQRLGLGPDVRLVALRATEHVVALALDRGGVGEWKKTRVDANSSESFG